MEDVAILVKNISKSFKFDRPFGDSKIINKKTRIKKRTFKALDQVSFRVSKGEVLGGKTTLLRIIAGIYKPDNGFLEVNGRLSPLLHLGTGFHGDLNAQENVIMNGMLLGISKSEIQSKVDSIFGYAELEKFAFMKLKHFSAGMRARLAFATAMQINPDILLVDEVMAVGDKEFQKKSYETFLTFTKKKKTILHASHNLEKLTEFSDRILLIHKGQRVLIGEPKVVIKKYRELR